MKPSSFQPGQVVYTVPEENCFLWKEDPTDPEFIGLDALEDLEPSSPVLVLDIRNLVDGTSTTKVLSASGAAGVIHESWLTTSPKPKDKD